MRAILLKIACAAGSGLIGSTCIMIWAVIDVKFSAEAWDYFLFWCLVVVVCLVLIVPHMIYLKLRGDAWH